MISLVRYDIEREIEVRIRNFMAYDKVAVRGCLMQTTLLAKHILHLSFVILA